MNSKVLVCSIILGALVTSTAQATNLTYKDISFNGVKLGDTNKSLKANNNIRGGILKHEYNCNRDREFPFGHDLVVEFQSFIGVLHTPDGGFNAYLRGITVKGDKVKTPEGLTVGSTKQDFINAYGNPDSTDGTNLTYHIIMDPVKYTTGKLLVNCSGNIITEIKLSDGIHEW